MVRPIGVTRQEKVNATTIGYELNRNTNSVAEQRRSDYRDVVVLQGLADFRQRGHSITFGTTGYVTGTGVVVLVADRRASAAGTTHLVSVSAANPSAQLAVDDELMHEGSTPRMPFTSRLPAPPAGHILVLCVDWRVPG